MRADGIQRTESNTAAAQFTGGPTSIAARWPVVTYALMAINIAVFVACMIGARSFDVSRSQILADGVLVRGNVFAGEYWRLLTSGFLHFDVIHLAVNMISLYILGRNLETALGVTRFIMVYFVSLLGGSAAAMLLQDNYTTSAGASGAIFGLMGAMLLMVLKLKMSPTPVLAIIGLNLVISFTITGISWQAHIGGLIFGAAATAALIYAPRVLPAAKRTQRNAAIVGWIGMAALLVIAVAISVIVAVTYTGMIVVLV